MIGEYCPDNQHVWEKDPPFPKQHPDLICCERCQVLARREGEHIVIVLCGDCGEPAITLNMTTRPYVRTMLGR